MSALLAALQHRDQLTIQQAVKGFNRLNEILGDLVLDTPTAATIITEFTERAIADGILPAGYAPAVSRQEV